MYEGMDQEIEELRRAQPPWRTDGRGIRGNPIEFQKEQAEVNWPSATFSRRSGREFDAPATAGSPQAPTTAPASSPLPA